MTMRAFCALARKGALDRHQSPKTNSLELNFKCRQIRTTGPALRIVAGAGRLYRHASSSFRRVKPSRRYGFRMVPEDGGWYERVLVPRENLHRPPRPKCMTYTQFTGNSQSPKGPGIQI